jgi:hypothetical protein
LSLQARHCAKTYFNLIVKFPSTMEINSTSLDSASISSVIRINKNRKVNNAAQQYNHIFLSNTEQQFYDEILKHFNDSTKKQEFFGEEEYITFDIPQISSDELANVTRKVELFFEMNLHKIVTTTPSLNNNKRLDVKIKWLFYS